MSASEGRADRATAGPARRRHPLATASVVLSALGFGPLIVVGGLIGAPLGAVAGQRIQAEPHRWDGLDRARIGIGLGLFTGATPVAVFCLAKVGDWGFGPLAFVAAYIAAVAFMAGGRGRRGVAAAAGGVGGILLIGVMVLAAMYAVVWVFVFMVGEIIDAIFSG